MPRRRRNFEDLSADYQARLRRAGIGPSQYETGASLQRARGHRPREHVTRYERNPLALTAGQYRFLKKQQIRATPRGAPKLTDFSRQISAFKRLSQRQRRDLMRRVAADHREYKRQRSISGRVRGLGSEGLRAEWRSILSGGGRSAAGEHGHDYDEEPEDYDYDEQEPQDYEEWDYKDYEQDYPDFDEDLQALLFYH